MPSNILNKRKLFLKRRINASLNRQLVFLSTAHLEHGALFTIEAYILYKSKAPSSEIHSGLKWPSYIMPDTAAILQDAGYLPRGIYTIEDIEALLSSINGPDNAA